MMVILTGGIVVVLRAKPNLQPSRAREQAIRRGEFREAGGSS
jgi:hypothetical protein